VISVFFKMSRPSVKPTQPLLQLVYMFFSGDKEDCNLKLVIHMRKVPRLKMSGVVRPLCAYMSWIGIRVPLTFISFVNCWVLL
jgi:hypothetical protein